MRLRVGIAWGERAWGKKLKSRPDAHSGGQRLAESLLQLCLSIFLDARPHLSADGQGRQRSAAADDDLVLMPQLIETAHDTLDRGRIQICTAKPNHVIDATLNRITQTSTRESARTGIVGGQPCNIPRPISQQRLRVADRGLREGILMELMAADNVWRRKPPHRQRPRGRTR